MKKTKQINIYEILEKSKHTPQHTPTTTTLPSTFNEKIFYKISNFNLLSNCSSFHSCFPSSKQMIISFIQIHNCNTIL